jgi:hypothetical protein
MSARRGFGLPSSAGKTGELGEVTGFGARSGERAEDIHNGRNLMAASGLQCREDSPPTVAKTIEILTRTFQVALIARGHVPIGD